MSDKTTQDSSLYEAAAFGIFDAAPDADTARAALLAEYDRYNWSDPKKALETLEYYGQEVKYKHADTSEFDKEYLINNAPITLADANKILSEKGETYDMNDVYDTYENKNVEILKATDNPIYLVQRQQLLNDIPKLAAEARRGYNIANRDEAIGPVASLLVDTGTRAIKGANAILNAPIEYATGWSINDRITELTDKRQDNTVSSAIIEGVPSGISSAASLMVNPVAGMGLLVAQGAEAVADRRRNTLYKTGSTSIANKATVVETGSQALQLAGEKLVFGKIASVAAGKIAGKGGQEVVQSMLTESGAEGFGQGISNVSENIENQQPLLTDVGRGVGTSTLVGGFSAGTLSAVANAGPRNPTVKANNVISESDSGVRSQEIKEFGAPLTPVKKQTIGPVNVTPKSTNTVQGLDDIGVTLTETNPEVAETQENTISVEVEPVIESSFITEDGVLYKTDENGLTYKESVEGKTEDSFDYIKFISDENTELIIKALKEGKQVIPGPNGTPVLESKDNGRTVWEPIEATDSPAEGLTPLQYSNSKAENKDIVLRPAQFGRRIKKVELPSIGAAGITGERIQSRYGERLTNSPNLPLFMQVEGENLTFTPWSRTGFEEDVKDLTGDNVDSLYKQLVKPGRLLDEQRSIAKLLHNTIVDQGNEAFAANDTARIENLAKLFKHVSPLISFLGTTSGRAQEAGKGMKDLTAFKEYNQTLENEIIAEAEAEGIDPLLIGQSEAREVLIDNELAIAEADVKRQEEREVIKDDTETQDLDNVIEAIELDAQDKVDTDLLNITTEEQNLQDDIRRTEKKAEKAKQKDIAVLEESIATDSIELVNSIELGKEISDTVGEETANTEEQVKASLDSAATATNSLIKTAVATERKNIALEKKSIGDQLKAKVERASNAYNNLKTKAATRLTNLKTEQKLQQNAGNTLAASELQTKIDDVNTKLTESATRLSEAKNNLLAHQESLTVMTEAEQEVENTLAELEGGVTIEVSPTSRTRRISVKTKRSGLDVTKLFKKGDAVGPLNALSQGINSLADTFKQGSTVKNKNSSRIKELNDRISKNKNTLAKAKGADSLTAAEKAKIEKARKRLEFLADEKQKATPESRMSASNKKKYDTYKKMRSSRPDRAEKSDRLKGLEERVKILKEEKVKVKGYKEKKDRAKRKAAQEAAKVAEVSTRADKLEQAIKSNKLNGTVLARAKADLAVLKGLYETDQSVREQLEKYFIVQMIGGVYGTLVGTLSAAIYPVVTATQLTFPTMKALANNMTSAQKMRYPLIEYLGGVVNNTALKRGVMIAKGALIDGVRLTSALDRSEVVATDLLPSNIEVQDKTKPKDALEQNSWQDQTIDYYNYTKNLPEATNFLEWVARTAQVFSGRTSGLVIRAMVASESITYALHDSGYDRATAALYYNKTIGKRQNIDSDIVSAENTLAKVKAKNEPKIKELTAKKKAAEAADNQRQALSLTGKIARVENKINEAADALSSLKAYKETAAAIGEGRVTDKELLQYMYDPEVNWKKAQLEAEQEAKDLRELGIEVMPSEQNVIAVQKYHAMRPKEVQIDVYKQAAKINLNAPAGGYSGLIAGWLEGFSEKVDTGGIRPTKYILPLANSIAQLMNIAASVTPLGGIAIMLDTKRRLYTDMERQMGISSSVVGTSIGASIALLALSQLDLPEDERWFDLIGGYSSDKSKRDTAVQNGVLPYSMRIGNVYIPFSETPFVLLLGAAASVVDKVRDGEEPDMTVASGLMWASMSSLSALSRMSMLRGLSDLEAGLETSYRQGPEEGAAEIGKIMLGKVKIMIPSSGLLRNIAQYTDNPVDAKKDMESAIVQGLPGIQSIFGRPLLDTFGEELPSKGEELVNGGMSLHRIFSTKRDDIDKRWLVNSGYSIPLVAEMKPRTSGITIDLNNELKYDILKEVGANSEIRDVVSRFRERYGNSAHNPEVQKLMNSQIRDIFYRASVRLSR